MPETGTARANDVQKKGTAMKSILDRSFRYTSSAATDLRRTFDRVRRQQRRQLMAQALADAPVRATLSTIRQGKNAAAR
jgi:hypothetical protein